MTDNTNTEDSAITELRAEIARLKAHSAELISEKRAAKADADAARDAAEEAANATALASNDLQTIKETLTKQFEKERLKLVGERDAASAHLNTLLIDNAIQRSLVENKVAAHMHDPLTAMFKAGATVNEGKAFFANTELSEHLNGYFETDTGKHFVAAPASSGGGALGSTKVVPSAPDAWNLTNYMKMKETDPAAAQAFASKHGKTFL